MNFLYTEVVRLLLGPWETRVSNKQMEPLSLGVSVVNWMCWLIAVLEELMAMFYMLDDRSIIHIPKPKLGWTGSSAHSLGFEPFHDQVSYMGAKRGTHGCTMNLEEEVGIFEANLQQSSDVLDGHRGSVVEFGVLL